MQDVTTLQFMRVIARYGGPDVYWTEYFRVHGDSRPEKWILESITNNPTGRPVVAQLIGNDIPALIRTARELQKYPIAAIDLNLGCPAPIVYRKCAGGGLLREPEKIDAILGALRDAVTVPFTVKTRIGFQSAEEFDELLPVFAKHPIDLLTIHARTVKQMYRPGVRYYISRNRVWMALAYGRQYPRWVRGAFRSSFIDLCKLAIAEDARWAKVRMILLGFRDGMLGRMGNTVTL